MTEPYTIGTGGRADVFKGELTQKGGKLDAVRFPLFPSSSF